MSDKFFDVRSVTLSTSLVPGSRVTRLTLPAAPHVLFSDEQDFVYQVAAAPWTLSSSLLRMYEEDEPSVYAPWDPMA